MADCSFGSFQFRRRLLAGKRYSLAGSISAHSAITLFMWQDDILDVARIISCMLRKGVHISWPSRGELGNQSALSLLEMM